MCKLYELQDGTYSIDDLYDLNELLDFKESMRPKKESKWPQQ